MSLSRILMAWIAELPYRSFMVNSYVIEGELRVEVILEQGVGDDRKLLRESLTPSEIRKSGLARRVSEMTKKF